jgi:voltage-gated sodium channel
LYRGFREYQAGRKIAKKLKHFGNDSAIAMGREVTKKKWIPKSVLGYPRLYYERLADICRYIAYSDSFTLFMTVVICLAGANIGAQSDPRVINNPILLTALGDIDIFILYTFLVEAILKLVAEKFRPYRYFKDSWNCFDCIIVIGSFIPGSGSILILLRLLRLLRIIKMIRAFPKLAMLVSALLSGLISIGYVGLILILVFYVFAILGFILFQNSDPWHFGNLHTAIITLFRSATLDNWYEVSMISMVGCDQGVDVYSFSPQMCVYPEKIPGGTVVFTMVFLVIASQILLVLFIGVIAESLDVAREQVAKEDEIQSDLNEIRNERGLTVRQTDAFRRLFEACDLEKNGKLSADEIEVALGALALDISVGEMRVLVEKLDSSGEGQGLGLADFIRFILSTPAYRTLEKIKSTLAWRKWLNPPQKRYIFGWTRVITHDEHRLILYEAAVMVQRLWRGKMAKRKVEAIIKISKLGNTRIDQVTV